MQADDDYDHAVFIHAARGERAFVMDPLGRGRYEGHWVSKADLRQFTSRFATASGSPYCAVVKRGGNQSSLERLLRRMREEIEGPSGGVVMAATAAISRSLPGAPRRRRRRRGGAPMKGVA